MTDPMLNEPTQRKIYMNRIIQGRKVKWEFVVDHEFTIIREAPVDLSQQPVVHPPNAQAIAAVNAEKLAKYRQSLDERGIKYTVTADNQIVINEVPQRENHISQFFDLNAPCPDYPGMESVRENYRLEIEQAGGAACPACQLNAIQRKYRQVLHTKFFNGQ